MAYRAPAGSHREDTAVCCVGCGSLQALALEPNRDGSFDCRKCGRSQPVLPDRDAGAIEVESMTFVEQAIGRYDELTPFAKELGKDVKTSAVFVRCDGIVCSVALRVDSGAVVGLDHHAMTTNLPQMRFVDEKPEHVEAKSSGVVREVQTGDRAFDDVVYVESSASDADVLTVLSSPEVRKAIVRLICDTKAIEIDENGVTFSMPRDARPYDPEGIRQRLAWLRVIAGAPRPLVSEPVTVPARARIAKALVGWSSPLGIFLMFIGLARWTPTEASVVVGCLGAGFLVALAMLPIWTILLKGRSTSHREILTWRITTFISAPITLSGVLVTCNGAFDRSPDRIVRMQIYEVEKDDENGNYYARAKDERSETHQYTFPIAPQKGQTLQVAWRQGAFGWTWENGSASVVEATER